MDSIIKELNSIKKMLKEQNMLKKEVINFNEAADYLDVSHSHLYKLTSSGTIPYYKPNGKKLYFRRSELDDWILSAKQVSNEEIRREADDFMLQERRSK